LTAVSPPAEDSSEEERAPLEESVEEESAAEEHPAEPAHRRHPSTLGGMFYLAILTGTVISLVVVSLGHWRVGVHALAGCLVVAAGLRLGLSERDAGMLAVRGRWIDGTLLAVLGVVLWFLASTVPSS
jgi:hypothetical protein